MLEPLFFTLTHDDLLRGLAQVLQTQPIAALTEKTGEPRYELISSVEEIAWQYKPTILSPKKFFFPAEEELLAYKNNGDLSAVIQSKPMVFFGIRPCDLNALKMLDEAFAEGHGDPNYLSRREKTMVMGMDCKMLCDPHAFCYRVDSHEAKGGFDVMLYPIKKGYLVQAKTARAAEFLKKYFNCVSADKKDFECYQQEKKNDWAEKSVFKKLEKFPEIFEQNKDHDVWKTEGNRCVSCGSCIMVCPTCYCFDVGDELDLNLTEGKRYRRWDACMVKDFATVAGGENFRHSATERLKHRINRKFNYLMKRHGQSVCVGCGRCVRACLADISPKKIAETIADEKE